MSERLTIFEPAADAARAALVSANEALMRRETSSAVASVRTLTDAGSALEGFVNGLEVACVVLGDSVVLGSMQVTDLINASDVLDRGGVGRE